MATKKLLELYQGKPKEYSLGYVSSAGDTMTGALTLSGDPTANLHATTKQYVDGLIQGLKGKTSVRAATGTADGSITTSGLKTIDDVSLLAGERVLIKNQQYPKDNGIYIVGTGAWARADDSNSWTELISAFVFVEEGTVNGDSGWLCTVDPGKLLETDPVTWVQFSQAGTVTGSNIGSAGTGIFKQKSGTVLQFKKLNAGSTKVTITDDTGNDKIDIDVAQANLDHGSIGGLGDDDHTQYVHTTTNRTITAQHSFSPGTAIAPFTLGTNAQGVVVTGLNADQLDGQHGSYYTNAGNLDAGTLPAARFNDTSHGSRGGGTLHDAATTTVNGFMSATDKVKLDSVSNSQTFVAGETIANGNLVNIYNDTGTLKVQKANATAYGKRADGFVLVGGAAGANLQVFVTGINTASTGLTLGGELFLSTTGGGVTGTAPSASGNVNQYIGKVLTTSSYLFQPGDVYELV